MTVRARFLVLVTALALLVGGAVTVPAQPAQAASPAVLEGFVYGGSSGSGIAGAYVLAYKYDSRQRTWAQQSYAVTDSRGSYKITGLPAGDYYLLFNASAGGWGDMYYPSAYQMSEATILKLRSTEHARINVVMQKTGKITGALADPRTADGAPARTPKISLYQLRNGNYYPFYPIAPKFALRSYELWNLPPGTYKVCVSDPGPAPAIYPTQCWRDQLDPAPVTNIQLEAGETVPTYFELRTPFADIPATYPNAAEINWMYRHGLELGSVENGERTFHPVQLVSRQEVARYFYRLGGSQPVPPPTAPVFTDVPADAPFALEIQWAKDHGLTNGNADGSFHPLEPVTNQATAAFLFRSHTNNGFVAPTVASFTDVPVGSPFFTEIEWAKSEGITSGYSNGDGTFSFRPTEQVTRQAMAVYMYLGIQAYGN